MALMWAGCVLHWWALSSLGPAFDRLVAPQSFVTTGPYRHLQHPIYVSYAALFSGFGLAFGCPSCALANATVCAAYYHHRTALEAQVLEEAFGDVYRDWAKRTAPVLPGLPRF